MSDQAQDDLVFWQYLFGTLGLGALCCLNGEMWAGVEWLRTMEPSFALGLLGFYALQLIGVQAILEIVQLFDATMVGTKTETVSSSYIFPRARPPSEGFYAVKFFMYFFRVR